MAIRFDGAMTPANGMMLICRTKPGTGDAIRAAGAAIAKVVEQDPTALAVLRLHYVRWVLFDDDTRFIYMAIFDSDFDKYVEDVLTLFKGWRAQVSPHCSNTWKDFPRTEGESRRLREVGP